MDIKEFIERLHELIAVDLDEDLIKNTDMDDNKICMELADGTKFNVAVKEGQQ